MTASYAVALPDGIRARFVDNANGLRMHLLEAGEAGRPVIVLLHGFPELAWSWRTQMPALAAAGYHVIAPDQRGYGRTTGWDAAYDGDLASFRLLNLVRDVVGLVFALGHRRIEALVGHDFGAIVAPWCVLLRPDVFRSMVLMSAPLAGIMLMRSALTTAAVCETSHPRWLRPSRASTSSSSASSRPPSNRWRR
jgi:pimeloyl-ACP methyl ester carboxylesterase